MPGYLRAFLIQLKMEDWGLSGEVRQFALVSDGASEIRRTFFVSVDAWIKCGKS